MNILLIYMIKVAVHLTAFYLVYSLLLSKDTTYSRNRVFILLSLIASLILPLITIRTGKTLDIQIFGRLLAEVFVSSASENSADFYAGILLPGTLQIICTLYAIGVILFLLKLFIDFLNLLFLIIKGKKNGSRIIRFHGIQTSGFSAMGYIFLNTKLNSEDADEIIKHEENHLKKNHFLDIIFIEIIKPFQWFNPVIYLINRDLRAIHEFQADLDCLNSGVPVGNYQTLLLNQVFKTKAFNLTNSFSNPSLVRKRMLMMTKKPSSALTAIKLTAVIPVAGFLFLAISAYRDIPLTEQKKDQVENTSQVPVVYGENVYSTSSEEYKTVPFVVVEEMPLFPGGDTELLKYLAANTRYPEKAKVNGTQGKVVVRFCVNENGGVDRISILQGVDPELDAEAARVVSTLPAFIPGRQGGIAVSTWYMVPLTFTLK